jgi:hypothetical protein
VVASRPPTIAACCKHLQQQQQQQQQHQQEQQQQQQQQHNRIMRSLMSAPHAQCNVHDVVFLEAMRPLPGSVDTFEVYFGGSDAAIGSALVRVSAA